MAKSQLGIKTASAHPTRETLCGAPIEPFNTGLPRMTQSLCPECSAKTATTSTKSGGNL